MNPNSDVDITLEDQQNLNKFSLLHQKTRVINIELAKYNEVKTKLEECNEELEMTDEERVHYVYASCFISVPLETAQATNEVRLTEVNEKVEELRMQKKENMKMIDGLKRVLSNKFGDKINLEE